MSSDILRKSRRKCKYVVELRYEPMPEAFDHRGEVIRKLHARFKSKMKHWSGENVTVKVADDLQNPTRQVLVEHRRCAITYEDPGSLAEFVDDADQALRLVKEVYTDAISEVQRLGVRFISIFDVASARSFDDLLKAVRRLYLPAELPISLEPVDFSVTLRHEAGQLVVGPVQQGEDWIDSMFAKSDQKIPDFGVAADVDSYATEITINDADGLINAFKKVLALTQASENELIGPLVGQGS